MPRMRRFVIVLAVFLLTTSAFAQLSDAIIDKDVRDTIEAWHLPGLAIAVVQSDKVIFLKSYGINGPKDFAGRKIGADQLPRLAVVRRLEQHVAAEVHRLRILRRQDDRRVPVEPVLVVLHRIADRANAVRIRRDVALGAAPHVGDANDPALQIVVDAPRLLQIRDGKESVAAAHCVPVVLADSLRQERVGGPAPGAVVLQPAAEHVGFLHVVIDVVELREGEVVQDVHRRAFRANAFAQI